MPWSMEFSTDGGMSWSKEKPEFLTLTTKEENGDLKAKTYKATFTAQVKTLQTSDIILKARPEKNNVDLSMVDIHGEKLAAGQSTANCYVIHNAGTYKFPTVYGNAKKNGQTNEKAYKSSKSGANILGKFFSATGEITKPEIEGIKDACLIWQDAKDLVSGIKYENNYVSFAVNKETIHNGNAIIAVRDNAGTILWSWHIWVTERDLHPVEVENFQHAKYKFLPVNLGWCGFGNELYALREVKVRITQTGGKMKEFTLIQEKNSKIETDGDAPFYQWGRKDPILPSDGTTKNHDKTYYTDNAQYAFANDLSTSDIKENIKNPHKFNVNNIMDNKYHNLWNADNEKLDANDDAVIKTVYDPSPVGYTVPAPNAFTGITTTGDNEGFGVLLTPAKTNAEWPFDKGWNFYAKPNKQGTTMFVPACGFRSYSSGNLRGVSVGGYYWVAGPKFSSVGRAMYFYSVYLYPISDYSRSYGFPIRCAQEK